MATQENSIPQAQDSPDSDRSAVQTGAPPFGRRRVIAVGVAVIAVAAVVGVISVFLTGSGGGAAETRIAVQEVINRVEAHRPRAGVAPVENFLPAVIGQDLVAGDGLRTHAASEARVDISVGDFIRVSRTKPNTLWRLGEYSVEDGTIIELEHGKIFLFDDADETDSQPIKVVTPVGAASPRGTWLSFSYDPVSEVAELQCFRGACILENEFGAEVLVDEQKSTVTLEAPPLKPVVMTITETETFEALPEVSTGELTIPTPEPLKPPTSDSGPVLPTAQPTPESASSPTPALSLGAGVPGSNRSREPEEPSGPLAVEPVRAPVIESTPDATATAARLPTPTPVIRPRPSVTFVPVRRPSPSPYHRPTFTPMPVPTATPKLADAPLPPVNSNVLPHVFVGTAFLDGAPAPEGTIVTAWMQGFSDPLAEYVVSGGSLTLLVPQYGPESMGGRTVEFRLNGLDAKATAPWTSGGADIVVLEASSTDRS